MTTEEIRAYMRNVPNEGGLLHPCPSLSELADYRRNACAPAVREAIQTHLMACSECSETFLELASIASAAEQPPPAPADASLEQQWKQ
jgi:hypothetical protein